MRWPWEAPSEGMVRVSQRRLIALQRDALQVAQLEREIAEAKAATIRRNAEVRALEVLAERCVDGAPALPAELPLTPNGRLHEEAFLALVEAQVWEQHEDELRRLADAQIRGGSS